MHLKDLLVPDGGQRALAVTGDLAPYPCLHGAPAEDGFAVIGEPDLLMESLVLQFWPIPSNAPQRSVRSAAVGRITLRFAGPMPKCGETDAGQSILVGKARPPGICKGASGDGQGRARCSTCQSPISWT